MDIYQALQEDHQEFKQLFAQLERSLGMTVGTRETVFTKLKKALEVHSEAEEEVFYTPLRTREETKDKIEHAKHEHQKVTKMLGELESMNTNDEQWLKNVTQLKEDVQHHIEEEEGDLFKIARSIFSQQQAEVMTGQFEQAKTSKV